MSLRRRASKMAWFKREKKPIENPTPVDERRVRTEGLWIKCKACRAIIWKKDLEDNWEVCPKCEHHFRLGARRRLELLLDDQHWIEHDADLASSDPLRFSDTRPYAQRLEDAQHKFGMKDAILTAEGKLNGRPVICCSMEFGFIGGSMGAVVGEKVARAIERSVAQRFPLIIVSCSSGARMMEGAVSLMQLAKVGAALARLDESRVPFISLLTDPTTGGVTASYAMLGDLNIAEPGALIGFAGPRVIADTIRQKLPEGFQTSEFMLEHGFLDAIVPRKELKPYIAQALGFFLDAA
jgi:acetyl-CoA carboxylase carboxyl transferase subunit beta